MTIKASDLRVGQVWTPENPSVWPRKIEELNDKKRLIRYSIANGPSGWMIRSHSLVDWIKKNKATSKE
jgi:hypothetical protein